MNRSITNGSRFPLPWNETPSAPADTARPSPPADSPETIRPTTSFGGNLRDDDGSAARGRDPFEADRTSSQSPPSREPTSFTPRRDGPSQDRTPPAEPDGQSGGLRSFTRTIRSDQPSGNSNGDPRDAAGGFEGRAGGERDGRPRDGGGDYGGDSNRNRWRDRSAGRRDRTPTSSATPSIARTTDERIRELDEQGEPLSIAEEIATAGRRGTPAPPEPSDESAGQLAKLMALSMRELVDLAQREILGDIAGMKRQDLVFNILKQRFRDSGLMYGEGTLEILPDGFGFLRSADSHYLSCPDDIYVSPSQIRRFNLRTGSSVAGQIRPPKENERYFALLRVEAVNHQDPSQMAQRVPFDHLTPVHPDERIILEHDPADLSSRVVDMIAPIGFGQRGLIVSPPRAGKTILMQQIARAILTNHPDAYVILLLVDERPEEVTDMERQIKGRNCEVISSTFDEPPARHVTVSEMVLEKAKRMVECGTDVVVLLDSITRLARAWNSECPQSGKLLSGGLDANAMQRPKSFFGSARKTEEGGSLTIIATALVETGSRMDEVIFEEFKGTGNLEIVLDHRLVEKRIWPALDLHVSGTRREERLLDPEEYRRITVLRRSLAERDTPEAMLALTKQLAKFKTNAEFLMSLPVD